MAHQFRSHVQLLILVGLCLVLFTGCNPANNIPTSTPTPEATAIPPTSTAAPAEIVWVDPQAASGDSLTTTISDFAAANSLQYRTVTALDPSGITSSTKIVVLRSEPANLSGLTAAASVTQFILLGSSSTTAAANLSVIQSDPSGEAFMAGYLTMLIAEDWRAGGLLTSDGSLGANYTDAFENGGRFVCGKCNPFYAPVVSFPVMAAEPTSSDSAVWLVAAGTLTQDWLSAAFIDPAIASTDVVNATNSHGLFSQAVSLISTDAVAQDTGADWAALLSVDYSASLKKLLPQVLSGQGGITMKAQITLTSFNEDIVTPAKQSLFNQTAADLAAGLIEPLSVQ